MKYSLCRDQDIPRGEKRVYNVRNIPIVVVHSQDDAFYAVYGVCPHQKGLLGCGVLTGMTVATQVGEYHFVRDGEILRCPWHGFEYDVITGRCLTDPGGLRIRTYPVIIDNHEVYLEI